MYSSAVYCDVKTDMFELRYSWYSAVIISIGVCCEAVVGVILQIHKNVTSNQGMEKKSEYRLLVFYQLHSLAKFPSFNRNQKVTRWT